MKIVQINLFYKEGSTGKIVYSLHSSYSKEGYDSYVIYGRGVKTNENKIFKVSSEIEAKIHSIKSRLFGVDFGFSYFATRKTIKILNKIKPDVVHLHCLNGHFINAYKLLKYLKNNNISTVLTLHAEIMHTAGCDHAIDCDKWMEMCCNCNRIKGIISSAFRDDAKHCFKLMKAAFLNFKKIIVVSVSPWLMDRAMKSMIFKGQKHIVVLNGVDTSIFHYYKEIQLKSEFGIGDKKIIFHVTPEFTNDSNHIKGGYYLIKLAKRMPDVAFIVAGETKLLTSELPSNIILLGNIKDQILLAKYYSISNVTLLVSKKETFSMVVAESLCCGTPVVGFEAGGPEMICMKEYCVFSKYGDINALEINARRMLEASKPHKEISDKANLRYSSAKMSANYLSVYKKMLNF